MDFLIRAGERGHSDRKVTGAMSDCCAIWDRHDADADSLYLIYPRPVLLPLRLTRAGTGASARNAARRAARNLGRRSQAASGH